MHSVFGVVLNLQGCACCERRSGMGVVNVYLIVRILNLKQGPRNTCYEFFW